MTGRGRLVAGLVVGVLVTASGVRPTAQDEAAPTIERVELAVDRLMADRPFVAAGLPPAATEAADTALLAAALASPDATMRALAVRSVGRFEDKARVPTLVPLLHDPAPAVEREAGNALALALRRASAVEAAPIVETLLADLDRGAAPAGAFDTLGRLPVTRANADRIEAALVSAASRDATPVEGATGREAEAALIALIGRDRTRPVSDATRHFLESRAHGSAAAAPSLEAWRALPLLGEKDGDLVAVGATYHCAATPDCGWQIRAIAVDLLDLTTPAGAVPLEEARHDVSVVVRLTAVRRLGRAITSTHSCAPLLETIASTSEITVVKLEALTRLDPACDDRATVVTALTEVAAGLSGAGAAWHEPARALETLARFDPVEARRIIAAASTHPVWQVRAAAARAAATLKDESLLVTLAHDPTPNVATEAVKALAAAGSAQAAAVAVEDLASADYQLIREAADALKKGAPARAEVAPLVDALGRLTREGKDTSRDPRTSILNRLKTIAALRDAGTSWLSGAPVAALTPLLADFDPAIATLTASVVGAATGTTPAARPTRRPFEQPTEDDLRHLPARATVTLGNGDSFDLIFLPTEAPVMIARFASLVRAGYYTNLTFHRVEPLFVIQGGSPGANEYTGAPRFFRDEIGPAHHTAGAVGMSTRGHDTGDGQLFVDLTDQYRLDYQYTVFATVSDLGPAERLLEGERIVRITFPN